MLTNERRAGIVSKRAPDETKQRQTASKKVEKGVDKLKTAWYNKNPLMKRFVPCKLNNEKHEKHQKDRESFMETGNTET